MKRVIAAFIILMIPTLGYSHPGRTDANGGHYNRKTGVYHFHNSGKRGLSTHKSKHKSYHRTYRRRK